MVYILAKIIDTIYSYDNTNIIQKAFLSFLQIYYATKDRPTIKNKKELAKYSVKDNKVYIPPLVVQYRIAYDIKYKTYISFLFSTIASINVAIDVYKAIISIVYIYIDPISNINYLTPSLLLAPYYIRYNLYRELDNIQREETYKAKELEFTWAITLDLAA